MRQKEKKKEYKEFIDAKKREKAKRWLEGIKEDKSMKLFWKAIGGKGRRERISKVISKEQWKNHFKT